MDSTFTYDADLHDAISRKDRNCSAIPMLSPTKSHAAVEKVADTFPVDGLWMDKKGNLYMSGLNQNAVLRRTLDGKIETLILDDRLQWPDTFSEGPDGSIYISASHINESPRFNKGFETRKQPFGVFKFRP